MVQERIERFDCRHDVKRKVGIFDKIVYEKIQTVRSANVCILTSESSQNATALQRQQIPLT